MVGEAVEFEILLKRLEILPFLKIGKKYEK